jgi:glycerophosphoryl diester phosphodiesterase
VIARFLAARALEAPLAVTDRLLAPYGALQVPIEHRGIPVVTPSTVAAAHHAGCEVHVWTVDEPVTMQDLLVKGVDGIITNRVDLLSELLDCA